MNTNKLRVLVIDDERDTRDTMRHILEHEGFEVLVAADGSEGIKLLRNAAVDVVVTDIFMPGKEGIETIYELRREFPGTRIIVMSGGGGAKGMDFLSVARELGADKSLKKPFHPRDLIDAVYALSGASPSD
jgi:two-component system, chemotaxis family, chemotaxis protein CheY